MRILVIEDEKRNANRLCKMLHVIDRDLIIEGPLPSVAESVMFLKNNDAPDLIISDIQLSDGLCFDIFNSINVNSKIIFTTAYTDYAITAHKYNSFDYLLKPIDETELRDVIYKFKQQQSNQISINEFKKLIETLKPDSTKYRERFLLPHRDGFRSILVKDINFIRYADRITTIVFSNGEYEKTNISMDDIEKELDPNDFFRANRQYIIKSSAISTVSNYFGGKLAIKLNGSCDEPIIVSRERAIQLKEWLDR
jgi:DNA-binding LytR/AlgR family response regulator